MNVVFTSQSPAETRHHGEDAHTYAKSLGYAYASIQPVLAVAQSDPRSGWYHLDEGQKHAVRYDRTANRWEIAEESTP